MSATERDELATTILHHPWLPDHEELYTGLCPECPGRKISGGHNSPSHADHLADALLVAGYRKIFDGDCGLNNVKDTTDREASEAWMRWANLVSGNGHDGISAMKQMLTEFGYRKPRTITTMDDLLALKLPAIIDCKNGGVAKVEYMHGPGQQKYAEFLFGDDESGDEIYDLAFFATFALPAEVLKEAAS